MKKWGFLLCFFVMRALACEHCVNLYTWTGYFPKTVLEQFEKRTGIHVVVSYFSSNAEMYTKLKASNNASGYDVVVPSSYYIPKMAKEEMLEALDVAAMNNLSNISKTFRHAAYDPKNKYSIPLYWGATGIVVNKNYFPKLHVKRWSQLWDPKFKDSLFMLDDDRELFSMSFLTLKLSPNTRNPKDIKKGFEHLKALMPNIKLFGADAIRPLFLGEDVTIGMVWTTDSYKIHRANPKLTFIYPEEGFVLWVDTLAIAKHAPHYREAMQFLHYLLEPKTAAMMGAMVGASIANEKGQRLLPKAMRESAILYPSSETLRRGVLQTDIGDARAIYAKYWEILKLSG